MKQEVATATRMNRIHFLFLFNQVRLERLVLPCTAALLLTLVQSNGWQAVEETKEPKPESVEWLSSSLLLPSLSLLELLSSSLLLSSSSLRYRTLRWREERDTLLTALLLLLSSSFLLHLLSSSWREERDILPSLLLKEELERLLDLSLLLSSSSGLENTQWREVGRLALENDLEREKGFSRRVNKIRKRVKGWITKTLELC